MSTLLFVDDNAAMRETLNDWFKGAGYDVALAEDGESALAWLQKRQAEVMVTDLRMPGLDGMGLLEAARRLDPALSVILMTAHGGVEEAVKAMRLGAEDFLVKPFAMDELELRVQRALDRRRQAGGRRVQEEAAAQRPLLGGSPAFKAVQAALEKVASAKSSVLLMGESGTGKELAARSLHTQSPWKDGPFVSVHCAALSPGLLESELFGHEKGAFTGAVGQRQGRFELAQGGTLFLDEVSEIPLETQVKLLRVLQEREFERVGGTRTLKADFRLVAASNRDLQALMREGRFREDLYYRLSVVVLSLPPLRERLEDIEGLAEHFGRRFCAEQAKPYPGLEPASLAALRSYNWPGNIRELQNLMEQAVVFAGSGSLAPRPGAAAGSSPALTTNLEEAMDRLESEMLLQALRAAHGVQAQAAARLGLSRSAIQYKVRKHGLEKHCRSADAD